MNSARVYFPEGNVHNEFTRILRESRVRSVFQPIISLRDGSVFGYEALARGPRGSALESPEAIIRQAEAARKLPEIEYLFRYAALKAAQALPLQAKIFLNVNPNIIQDEKFREGYTAACLRTFNIIPERVYFEITERESIFNMGSFRNIIEHYKGQNYRIGVDDVGAGYSGLNLIADVQPHFIKLDMQLVRDIDKNLTKQAIVKGMCEFAAHTGCFVIAEGVESPEELLKLIELDVGYAQGYLIQRPQEAPQALDESLKQHILRENKRKNRFFGTRLNDFYIKNICRPSLTIGEDTIAGQLAAMFDENAALSGVCVVKEGSPVGVITRSRFFQSLSGKFGYSLFAGKSVDKIMDRDFLQVDYRTTIDLVAKKAMLRDQEKLYDFVIITREGKYLGVVTIKALLEKSIEIEVANAKHLNPLSELPGNAIIEMRLEKALRMEEDACVLYFDLDNFKAYNDHYGFEHGDTALKSLTRMLKNHVAGEAFLGHIGGDDFIALVDGANAEAICRAVLEDFDREAPRFYSSEDAERGHITVKNRHGVEETFSLMTLTIVGVFTQAYDSIYALAEAAGRLKKRCKARGGSNFLLHREDDASLSALENDGAFPARCGGLSPAGLHPCPAAARAVP